MSSSEEGANSGEEQESVNEKDDNEDEYEYDDEFQISFSSYQLFCFLMSYFSYCILLYNRRSFIYTLPHILMDRYYSSYEVGMILGAQTCTYTVSRYWASWATDTYSPRSLLAGALFLTGIVMLAFTDQEDWQNLMMLSAANGAAQGLGWPAVTKVVRAWFPPTQFGLWFALISTADNLMIAMSPSIANALSVTYGWQRAIQLPALAAVLVAPVIPFWLVDKPSDVGYEDQLSMFGAKEGHWSDIVGSEFMMLLASTFCMLFVIQTACTSWGPQYLIQERGVSVHLSSSYLFSMEIGGIIGGITVGALTDFMVRRGYYFGTGRSPRMIIVQLCTAGSYLFLNLFLFSIDPDTSRSYISSLGFLFGFCMYGAISLVGTVAVEVAPIHITGAAHAFIGLAANIGAVIAGVPMEYAARSWDWLIVFMGLNLLGLFVFMILIIGKDIKATFAQENSGPAKLKKMSSKKLSSKKSTSKSM